MIPCFFGSSQQQLYGVYTPAEPVNTPCGAAVLLCPPIGQEYMRAHWMFRALAKKLSSRGIPSFRFDYPGTGDSLGPANLEAWKESITLAEKELQERSGFDSVAIIGLRFGGTLAFLNAAERSECGLLMLWDPVLSGRDYLDFLRYQDGFRRGLVHKAPARISNSEEEELRGFILPSGTVRNISQISLLEYHHPIIPPVVVISSRIDQEMDRFAAHHRSRNAVIRREVIEDGFAWENANRFSDLIIPGPSLESLISLFFEETSHE